MALTETGSPEAQADAGTPAPSPADSHTGAKIAAGGAALALVGIPTAMAPVHVATGTAKDVVAGSVAATTATMGTVSNLIGKAVQSVLATRYPDVQPDLTEIQQRAAAFPAESAARVKTGMREALSKPTKRQMLQEIDNQLTAEAGKKVPDPKRVTKLTQARLKVAASVGPRESAVSKVLSNEKRYAALHAKAQMARAVGIAEHARLEQSSPEGGYWMLGEAENHTEDCLALAGHTYPHSVLRRTFPPLHIGCVCRVISIQEAINRGLITPDEITPPKDAIQHAKAALALHEHDAMGLMMIEELRSRGVNLLEPVPADPSLFEEDWGPEAPSRLAGRIGSLAERETLRLPDGTAIRKKPEGIQVRRDGAVKRGLSVEEAAQNALDRSARSGKPESIGGRKFADYDAYLAEFDPGQLRGKDGRWAKNARGGGSPQLTDFLKQVGSLQPGGSYDYVVKNGQSYKPTPLPEKWEKYRGKMGLCYANAANAVLGLGEDSAKGLHYVEGYALPKGLIPIQHAWLADAKGNAYDVTWPDGGGEGAEYFGVPFTNQKLRKILLDSGHYGVIGHDTMHLLEAVSGPLGPLSQPGPIPGGTVLIWDGSDPYLARVVSTTMDVTIVDVDGIQHVLATSSCQPVEIPDGMLTEINLDFEHAHPRAHGGRFRAKFDALGNRLDLDGGPGPAPHPPAPLPPRGSTIPYRFEDLEERGAEIIGPGPWENGASEVVTQLQQEGIKVPGTTGMADTQGVYKPDGVHYTPEREALHAEIIKRFLQGVQRDRKPKEILFMGGGPASGKSSLLKSEVAQAPSNSVLINPDAIKAMLPEYQILIQRGDRGASSAVHEESSDVAKMLVEAAAESKRNITVDKVKIKPEEVQRFRNLGYDPRGAVATLPISEAQARADFRGSHSGRFVSPTALTADHKFVAANFENWAKKTKMPIVLRDTATGSVLATADNGEITVHDPGGYHRFRDRAHTAD